MTFDHLTMISRLHSFSSLSKVYRGRGWYISIQIFLRGTISLVRQWTQWWEKHCTDSMVLRSSRKRKSLMAHNGSIRHELDASTLTRKIYVCRQACGLVAIAPTIGSFIQRKKWSTEEVKLSYLECLWKSARDAMVCPRKLRVGIGSMPLDCPLESRFHLNSHLYIYTIR